MIARVAASLLGGGVFYSTLGHRGRLLETVILLLAPVVTGAGFATGLGLLERWTGSRRAGFTKILPWPVLACALGAALVFPYGPMLIVFGMLLAGTLGIVILELAGKRRRGP